MLGNGKPLILRNSLSFKPDLIIITGRQGASYEKLTNIAPTINLGANSANYLDSVEANIQLIGELFDKQMLLKHN